MRGLALTVGMLLLATVAVAEDAPQPVSDNAVYLRMLVGVEKPILVSGFLDETRGTGQGYDVAFLDLDGDGILETRQEFGTYDLPRTGEKRPDPKVRINHEGCDWVLDLRYSRFTPTDGVATAHIRWSVTRGKEFYAWFINGKVKFYTDPKVAAAADPIRMGPPFRFDTGTRARGRQGLVSVGLKDANGSTLRLARKNGQIVQPILKLFTDGTEVLQTQASYG
jgi:hypothetical protein